MASLLLAAPALLQAQAAFTLPAVPVGPGLFGDGLIVTRFIFEGHTVVPTADLEAVAAPFLSRPLRGVELEELRQRLSRLYVDRGFVSSGALIPDDVLQDGSLRVQIVEGRVAELRLNGMGRLSDAYLAARLARPGEVLDANVLQERFRLLLADPLFERLNVRLSPGSTLGSSIVDVDVVRARPVRLTLFANNHQAPAVGSRAAGVEAVVRNLTGWGDTFAATLSKSGGSDNADLAFTLPLAARTTFLSARIAQGASSVVEEPLAALDIGSRVKTRELTLGQPLLETARRRLTLGLTYAERSNRTTIDGQPFSFSAGESTGTTEIQSWRFFQDLVMRFDRHVLALRSTFAAGRNNLVADDTLPGQPPARYRLWVGQLQSAISFGGEGTQLLLRGQLQRSADRLVPLEQMSVGGRHTVRGYRENQLVRDNGYAFSAEWHQPLIGGDAAAGPRLALIPFVDIGGARNHGGERARLASAGLGLQWSLAGLEGDLFYARRLHRRAVDSRGDWQDRGLHLSLRWHVY